MHDYLSCEELKIRSHDERGESRFRRFLWGMDVVGGKTSTYRTRGLGCTG